MSNRISSCFNTTNLLRAVWAHWVFSSCYLLTTPTLLILHLMKSIHPSKYSLVVSPMKLSLTSVQLLLIIRCLTHSYFVSLTLCYSYIQVSFFPTKLWALWWQVCQEFPRPRSSDSLEELTGLSIQLYQQREKVQEQKSGGNQVRVSKSSPSGVGRGPLLQHWVLTTQAKCWVPSKCVRDSVPKVVPGSGSGRQPLPSTYPNSRL